MQVFHMKYHVHDLHQASSGGPRAGSTGLSLDKLPAMLDTPKSIQRNVVILMLAGMHPKLPWTLNGALTYDFPCKVFYGFFLEHR